MKNKQKEKEEEQERKTIWEINKPSNRLVNEATGIEIPSDESYLKKNGVLLMGCLLTVLLPVLSISISDSMKVSSPSFTYGCRELNREYKSYKDEIIRMESNLPTYDCPGNTTYPELLNALDYMSYLTNYTDEWVNNITDNLELYRLEIEQWQEDISTNLEALDADLESINNLVNSVYDISSLTIGRINSVLGPIKSVSEVITRVRGYISYRVSTRVAGIRIRFSIRVPYDICDLSSDLCGLNNLLQPLLIDLANIKELLLELPIIELPKIDLPPLPMPPSLRIFDDYDPKEFKSLNLKSLTSIDLVDVGGITIYGTNINLPEVNLSEIMIPGAILNALWTFKMFIKFTTSRHSFYSVKNRLMKSMSYDHFITHSLASAVGEVIIISLISLAVLSLVVDFSCNSCRLYQYGQITLDLDSFQDRLEASYFSCINCIGNQTYCDTEVPPIEFPVEFERCDALNRGILDTLDIEGTILFIILGPSVGAMLLRNLLQIICIRLSSSPSKMAKKVKSDWLTKILNRLVTIKRFSIIIKLLISPLFFIYDSYSVFGFILLFIYLIDSHF